MICRRCGTELPDNALRCTNCGTKLNMYCPECKTINVFGSKICKNCGFELLVNCPVCSSLNYYSSEKCRKCNSSLTKVEPVAETELLSVDKDFEIVKSFSVQQTSYVSEKKSKKDEKQILEDETHPTMESVEAPNEPVYGKFFKVDVPVEPDLVEQVGEQESSEVIVDTNGEVQEEIVIEDVEAVDNIVEEYDESVNESILEEQQEEEQVEEIEEEVQSEIRPEFVKKTMKIVSSSLKKHIIAINGSEGCGKSAVLKQVTVNLGSKGFVSLYGSCTPLVQITSFGFFQDAFLRMMGFPPYANSTESFIKDFKKSNYAKLFNFLDGNELTLFLNIFYPSQKDNFDNILENKKIMFSILEKVIKSFLVHNNLVIAIDNFELLDGASYDFIIHMLKKGYFNNRLKLLVAYQENKSIQSYFDVPFLNEEIFETILIDKFSREELIDTVTKNTYIDIEHSLPIEVLEDIIQKSDGNAIRLEQEVALLCDTGYLSFNGAEIVVDETKSPEINPVSLAELMKLRISLLTPSAKNVLFMAAIMGYRFATSILCRSVTMPVEKAEKILNSLIQDMFIQKVDNYTCEFKSLALWMLIYQEAKSDLLYKENSERLYLSLKPLILSSNLQKLISCTEALSKNEAFLIWQNTASISAKLGDTNLYVIAQKQCLKILEEQDILDSEVIKSQIYEEIGKILCEKSPKEAVTYLANVLDAEIKESNIKKIVDLSGYFIKSCYLTGNYFGVTEAIEAIIKSLDSAKTTVSETDIALINTRKLKALLSIGNSEQIVNLVNEEIVPELERALSLKQIDSKYKALVMNALLLSKIVLAKAYLLQGNNQVLNVVSELRNLTEKYNVNKMYYHSQIEIIDAFAKTIVGEINKSNEILNNLANEYKDKAMDTNLLAEWNLVCIINRVLAGQNTDLKVDLFELAAFTNNINEHFIKNIIKLILGYVLKEEGNTTKALEIFNEEITYFAKEKVAIGALLSWALIVQIYMSSGDDEKAMNTANKSLEIAQSPKINNYFFIIYFQRYLADLYMKKGDLVATKMYLEKSIMLAKQFDLKYQLIELYIAYAKYLEQTMSTKRIYSSENIKTTLDMYNKAVLIAKELRLANMIEKTTKERSGFKTFCQLNSIEI